MGVSGWIQTGFRLVSDCVGSAPSEEEELQRNDLERQMEAAATDIVSLMEAAAEATKIS